MTGARENSQGKLKNNLITSYSMRVFNDPNLSIEPFRSFLLPNNKCACLVRNKSNYNSHIVFLCTKMAVIQHSILPKFGSSITALTVADRKFLIFSDNGYLFLKNIHNENSENPILFGDSSKEGLPTRISHLEVCPMSEQLISFHPKNWEKPVAQIAVWDLKTLKLINKIKLSKEFNVLHPVFAFLNSDKIIFAGSNQPFSGPAHFMSVNLRTSTIENLFTKLNIERISHLSVSSESTVSWVEISDKASKYKYIQKPLASGEEKIICETQSMHPSPLDFRRFFQTQVREGISSVLSTPEGYVIGFEGGIVKFFSNDHQLIRTTKVDVVDDFYSGYHFELKWNPYKGSIAVFGTCQIIDMEIGYKQGYHEILSETLPEGVVKIVTDYLGIFSDPPKKPLVSKNNKSPPDSSLTPTKK